MLWKFHLLAAVSLGWFAGGKIHAETARGQELQMPAAPAKTIALRTVADGWPELTFDHDVSDILGAEDDYTVTLSAFDYAAKFKSDRPLDAAERAVLYRAALDEYTEAEIGRLKNAFHMTFKAMEGMTVKLPATIHIFSEQTIESGAAYTRANTICMPKGMIGRMDDGMLAGLAAHEMFHVISRHNQALRPAIYSILGFKWVKPIQLPTELAARTIANPDAPGMDYVIEAEWQGKKTHFLPILHSKRAYTRGSFFHYLQDDLLVVDANQNPPIAVLADGKPVILSKEEVNGYYEQVGRNTDYTFHPEETSADHFKLLLFGKLDELPNPDKIEALDAILKR